MHEKMAMVIAIIFGCHLLHYGGLYQSKRYYIVAVAVPFIALGMGLYMPPYVVAAVFALIEILFTAALMVENRKLAGKRSGRE